VGCETGVQQQARHDGVRISTFRIIYELMDFVKQRMLDLLPPEYKEVVKGHAEIRATFDIGKTGRVAGCQMIDGAIRADGRYRIFRNKKDKIWEGKLASLKHFQNEVAEISGLRSAEFCSAVSRNFKWGHRRMLCARGTSSHTVTRSSAGK
jgi:translation initiation factor IF-2